VTVMQSVLVFGVAPLAVTLVVCLLAYGKALMKQPHRYRPGKPWNFRGQWYVAHPAALREPLGSNGAATAVGGAFSEW
jgi:hypothetical protein